jgi:predicted AAA+ superfamily ATPase
MASNKRPSNRAPEVWPRTLLTQLKETATQFPLVSLVGARQCGKTTLCRDAFPGYRYVSLEDPDERRFALEDPRSFLDTYPGASILDEVQHVPELFSYLQSTVDQNPGAGQYILSGSQHFLLNDRISQSLAGRMAVLELHPMSFRELKQREALPEDPLEAILQGGYPNVHVHSIPFDRFYTSYIQTYLERDVRQLTNVRDLSAFQTFLELLAGQAGQELNLHQLAAPVGRDWATLQQWLSVLEASFLVFRQRPYHRNYRKRIIKAPKLYFVDTGLCCALLGIRTKEQLRVHPLYGALFENAVVADIHKEACLRMRKRDTYHWRDRSQYEVDVVLDEAGQPMPVEVKATKTLKPEHQKSVERFRAISGSSLPGVILYGGDKRRTINQTHALPWHDTAVLFDAGMA